MHFFVTFVHYHLRQQHSVKPGRVVIWNVRCHRLTASNGCMFGLSQGPSLCVALTFSLYRPRVWAILISDMAGEIVPSMWPFINHVSQSCKTFLRIDSTPEISPCVCHTPLQPRNGGIWTWSEMAASAFLQTTMTKKQRRLYFTNTGSRCLILAESGLSLSLSLCQL